MGDTQDALAVRAKIDTSFPQIALHFAIQHGIDFSLAVGASGINIFSLLKRKHAITAFVRLSADIYSTPGVEIQYKTTVLSRWSGCIKKAKGRTFFHKRL